MLTDRQQRCVMLLQCCATRWFSVTHTCRLSAASTISTCAANTHSRRMTTEHSA